MRQKYNWQKIDWSKNSSQLARELGCSRQAVCAARKRLNKSNPKPTTITFKIKQLDTVHMTAPEIAAATGSTRSYVAKVLKMLGLGYRKYPNLTYNQLHRKFLFTSWLAISFSKKVISDIHSRCCRIEKLMGINLDEIITFLCPNGKVHKEAKKKIGVLCKASGATLNVYCYALRLFWKFKFRDSKGIKI